MSELPEKDAGFSVSRSDKLAQNGLRFTKLYLITIFGGLPVLAYFGAISVKPLSLNEIGDFLAGAFGPLALFWVVLGFFQQGEELRNSVEALKLQAEELRNAVEQQKELVGVTKEAYSAERQQSQDAEEKRKFAIKPRFEPTRAGGFASSNSYTYKFRFLNQGADATNITLSVYPEPFELNGPKHWPYTKKFEAIEGAIRFVETGVPEGKVWDFEVCFQDSDGDYHKQLFHGRPTSEENNSRIEFLTK